MKPLQMIFFLSILLVSAFLLLCDAQNENEMKLNCKASERVRAGEGKDEEI